MTNRETLNAMSNTGLDMAIGGRGLCGYIQDEDNAWCEARGDCTNCVVQWLGSERKEG